MTALKIGILTFHRCINYGSYWQARCLAEGLQEKGHAAEILDHESGRVNFAEWRCAYRPTLPTHVPESDYPLYREKIERFFRIFDTLPLSRRFPLDRPEEMPQYDAVVVGSDEVWNHFHPWYGKNPLFYGEGLRADRLISYAASFGNYPASWGLDTNWAGKLRNFDSISVRDENSRAIVRNATGLDPVMVLDPCLQFEVRPDKRESPYWEQPYVAVYGHNFSESYIRRVRSWANHRNLPLISIGYRNDWADVQWLTADPHDFAHFIAQSEAVVTNFFHGCVFALRNARPFACETTTYRSYKVSGLMAKVGAEGHLILEDTPDDVFRRDLDNPVSPLILQKIDTLRQVSHAYLDGALALKKTEFA